MCSSDLRRAGGIRKAERPGAGGRARGVKWRGHLAPLCGDGRQGRLRGTCSTIRGLGAGAEVVGSAHPLEPRRPTFAFSLCRPLATPATLDGSVASVLQT